MTKVGFISLGCSKNLIDTEIMIGILKENGYEVTAEEDLAEIIIINTCGFIDSAKEEAIDTILETATLKEKNLKMLIVTGCLVQRYGEEVIKELPEIDKIVGVTEFFNIADIIKSEKKVFIDDKDKEIPENLKRELSTPPYLAYLKIAEGCNNHCTYCAIPGIRGKFRSRCEGNILKEAEELVKNGVKEINIIAQDTGRYGTDFDGQKHLADLISKIEKIGADRIRFLYTYPETIDDKLIETIKNCKTVVPYLDMPLQHISNSVLKRMGRKSTKESIYELIEKLRREIPNVTLRTTFMVGFPGETEQDFEELTAFIKWAKFDKVGVFRYSNEEGTPAFNLSGQVSDSVKQERYNRIMALQQEITDQKENAKKGETVSVIVEGFDDGLYFGRSREQAPDIDGNTYFSSKEEHTLGDIVNVRILYAEDYDLIGEEI